MKEHSSLIIEPPTQPLVDKKEINEIAKQSLLKQINYEIRKLTETEDQNKQILSKLEEILSLLKTSEDSKTRDLKLEVLQKLKAKLETG